MGEQELTSRSAQTSDEAGKPQPTHWVESTAGTGGAMGGRRRTMTQYAACTGVLIVHAG